MRPDMAKVIVERPRRGGGHARKGRARDPEDLPQAQGIRRPHREAGDFKTLNENLAPLRRFLEGQVGRPWNKVFAEIALHLRAGSAVQQHVRDHIADFVALHPEPAQRYRRPRLLYVDPRDGLLKRTDQRPEEKARRRREAAPPIRIAIDAMRELRQIDGLWYEIRFAPLPDPAWSTQGERRLLTEPVRDALTHRRIPAGPPTDTPAAWTLYRRTHPERRYAAAKRQLSARELRRYGIGNGVNVAGRG